MDKILFIVPPYIKFDSFINPDYNERSISKKSGNFGSIITEIPIGLLSMSAYIKAKLKAEIKLIDFNIILNNMENFKYSSFEDLFQDFLSSEKWLKYSPTIIGISALFTPSYHNMFNIAKASRKIFKDAIILAGGGVPTNMYREIFKETTCFDALCFGEGEKPLLKLIAAKDKQKLLKKNKSWITKDKAENNELFEFDFIENLDKIPFLDFDILNIDDYALNTLQGLFPHAEKQISMPVMTSRGCPHRCCFCSSHTVHGRKMRYFSIDRIKREFTHLAKNYGAKTIVFFDDHLMSNRQRVFEIINIMNDLQISAFFPSSLALYALDRKMLEALKSIRVNHLVLSVESGSTRVLKDIMHKPLDLKIVKQVIKDCRDLEIATDVSVLIGLPDETKQDIENARSFFKTLNPTWFRFSIATPLVGSEMFNECLQNNYFKGNYIDCDFKKGIIETEEFTTEYIQEKAYSLNLELNFLMNSDFKLGKYETSLKGFENTINIRDDHAFAYYFAAKCCENLNLFDKFCKYRDKYLQIINESEFWQSYVKKFELTSLQ